MADRSRGGLTIHEATDHFALATRQRDKAIEDASDIAPDIEQGLGVALSSNR
jgi:hypothetical protein